MVKALMKDCKLEFEPETLLVGGLGVRLFALGVRLASQTLNQRDAEGPPLVSGGPF